MQNTREHLPIEKMVYQADAADGLLRDQPLIARIVRRMETMREYLAIAVYRSLVEGKPTGSLDVQTKFFSAESTETVREIITHENPESYRNNVQESVTWELTKIMAIEEFKNPPSGDEVIGIITNIEELRELV